MKDVQETAKQAGEKVKEAGEKVRGDGDRSGTLARRLLVPMGAALTSAAVSYAAKKLPKVLEQQVLPKLRQQGDPRDLARDVTQRARGVVEQHTPLGGSDGSSNGQRSRPRMSRTERERERAARAERRQERKTARSS